MKYPGHQDDFRDVGFGTWESSQDNFSEFLVERPVLTGTERQFWNPGFVSYAIVPRCRSYSTILIDYRCADGRFLMLPRGRAVSNTRHISSSETRVNAGIRGWKSHLSESTWCQEFVGGICFTNKWGATSLQPLTFSNRCENVVFSNVSLGLTVRFSGTKIGVFWKRESRPIEWRQCRLSIRQLFFLSAHL